MIIIGSEWHAYFSIYAQFGSNLSIYVCMCRCRAKISVEIKRAPRRFISTTA